MSEYYCDLADPPAGGPHTGYYLYIAPGGLADVDFAAGPTAFIPAGYSSCALVGYDFAASTRYTLVLRPVIDDAETPDVSCRFEFETDSGGQWTGLRPCEVEAASVKAVSGARAVVSWTYRTPDDNVAPADFGVYHASSPDIAAGAPQATVAYEQDGVYSCTLSLSGGQTYFFGVTARDAGGAESHMSPVIGPLAADSSLPMTPPVVLTTVF